MEGGGVVKSQGRLGARETGDDTTSLRLEREGIPHAPVREKTVSREQKRKKEEGGASQSVVQKEEGSIMSQKKGDDWVMGK